MSIKPFSIIIKSGAILFLILAYVVSSVLVRIVPFGPTKKRAFLIRNSSLFAGYALGILGINAATTGRKRLEQSARNGNNAFIVCNHVSSLDILVLASMTSSVFVTSVELKSGLITGIIAQCGGSIYVERRSIAGLKKEIDEIAGVLRDGFNVVIFPEGTTSDGERVRPFKVSLFDSAIRSGVSILPVCLRYRKINAQELNEKNRDSIFYYGGVSFIKHALRVLSVSRVDVEAKILDSIPVSAGTSRKELASECHHRISTAYLHR